MIVGYAGISGSSVKDAALAGTEDITRDALFLPSKRRAAMLVALGLGALGLALLFRFGLTQNTPLGLACEAGDESLICDVRIATIVPFMWNVFGLTALVAALIQLWRPNVIAFGTGLAFALLGLVLYNTRLSALAMALLVLSLARAAPEEREGPIKRTGVRATPPASWRCLHWRR
jgi:hypothetical protein